MLLPRSGSLNLDNIPVYLIQSIQCRDSDNKWLETTLICSNFHLDLQIFLTFSVSFNCRIE